MINKQEIKKLIEEFNYRNVVYKIESQTRLLKYNKILLICLHIINALSIIASVLSQTLQDQLIYVVIVCNICNSIINFEILRVQKSIQNNTKFVNDYMKNESNDIIYTPENLYMNRCNNTPINSPTYIEV